MLKIRIAMLFIGSMALLTFNASAANSYFEARNDAMGGAGVASSHYSVAPLSNPALLSKSKDNDRFSILLSSIGIEGNFPNGFTLPEPDKDTSSLSDKDFLKKFAQNNLNLEARAQVGGAFIIAVPMQSFSAALVMNTYGIGNSKFNLNAEDVNFMLSDHSNDDENTEVPPFVSSVSGKLAVINETGLSFSKTLAIQNNQFVLGVTAKSQCIYLANAQASLKKPEEGEQPESVDDLIVKSNSNTGGCINKFNADIGATIDLYPNLTVGLAIQNIIPYTVTNNNAAVETGDFKIRPQVTTGIALNYGMLTGALDVDLTPESGFDSEVKRQFIKLGGEVNLFKWLQFRAGYRTNMLASSNIVTSGFGFSPFDVLHLDITSMIDTSDGDLGVVAQFKLTF